MDVQRALSWRRPHAGIIKATLKEPGLRHIKGVLKVKAHVDEGTVDDSILKRHARGNTFADEAAALGVDVHPHLCRDDTSISAYHGKIQRIALTVASASQLWSKSSVTNGALTRRPRPASSPELAVSRAKANVTLMHMRTHATHYLLGAGLLLFCGVCGAYSEQRVSKVLLAPCLRRPNPAHTRKQRHALMSGQHPVSGASLPMASRIMFAASDQ